MPLSFPRALTCVIALSSAALLTHADDSTSFVATFNGGHSPADPGPPLVFDPPDWDIQVHRRSAYEAPGLLQAADVHHGPNCEAPGEDGSVTHTVNTIEGAVYTCANHVMTGFRADDYGLISLTPPALVDFSAGEATITFDVSTLSVSRRDWFSVVIQPYDDNLVLPLEEFSPDLNGYGRSAIALNFEDNVVCPVVYRDFSASEGRDKFSGSCRWWIGWEEFFEPSAMQRQTIEVTISRDRVRVSMPEHDLVWDDMEIAELDWSLGVVSFGHHSYTPFKDGNGGPNTWHWDNVAISPARPFTILRADKRWVNQDNAAISFDQPAPADSHLRGSALGTKVQVSFDDGATWSTARQQPSQRPDKPTWQFWHPVPEGTRKVLLRSGEVHPDWWSDTWVAKDISIFSLATDAPSDPAPPSDPPPPDNEPAPAPLRDCHAMRRIYDRTNGAEVLLEENDVAYKATDCVAEQPR